MVFIVDVEVRRSCFQLVTKFISSLKDVSQAAYMESFVQLLKSVIIRKLIHYSLDSLKCLSLTANELLLEGHGNISIQEPPTDAQKQLIKSLLKIIFHQLNTNGDPNNYDNENHDNLIISLFFKKINVESFQENNLPLDNLDKDILNLHNIIKDALKRPIEEPFDKTQYSSNLKLKFTINFFICMEEFREDLLLEEFDKIDLKTSSYSMEESTILSGGEELNEAVHTSTITKTVSNLCIKNLLSKETLNFARITELPSELLEGSWETLFLEDNLKQRVFSYATISMELESYSREFNLNNLELSNALMNNKLLLVHGPPGSGKTTFCKSLCQKLAIRNKHLSACDFIKPNYKGIMIEIISSHIFSRWFGESSKNISILFDDIEKLLKLNLDKETFVCVLIDEVEAIAGSRQSLIKKNESNDSVRVVNTLLTRLDSLKKYRNFLILATSNLLDALDPAFVDRADGIFFVGDPNKKAIFNILCNAINSLIKLKILYTDQEIVNIADSQYQNILNTLANKCFVS